MNQELTKKLTDKFEFFYRDAPITESLMSFGFECGDGWFQLIWDLCEKIEEELQEEDPKEKTKHMLRGHGHFQVVQVKEKFGTLRFYADGANKAINDMIGEAESKSAVTCEGCGKPGTIDSSSGWVSTLCNKCRKREKATR